jgi:signal transduction histidine kinase
VIYLSDKETQAQNLMELSISYRMLNRYPLSLQHLDSALKVNLEFRNTQQLADIHRNYALTYAQIGNFKKAYEHEVLAVKNEKINKEEQDRHLIEDMKTRYESLTKDQMITELETEKLKEEAKRSRNINQRNYLIISLLFSTFLFSSFIYYLQQRRKKEHIIGRQKLELQNLRIDDLLNEQAANSMSSLLEGQEKERKRVALDLHDRMGSLLAMVKLHLTEGSKMALPLLEKAITEVRKISPNLASNTLDDFGLSVALAELKKMVEESGKVAFTLHTYKIDKRFPAHIEINLYRIIQELINNSLKHAEPGKISLSLTRREDAISLVYEDNGQGFNLEQALHQTGIGLWNVQNRADQMGGKLHINTQPGKGMEVILEIPLNEQKTL